MAKRRPKNNNVKNSRISNYVPGESSDLTSTINRLIQVLEAKGGGGGGFGNKEEKESSASARSKKLLNKLGFGNVNNLAETFLPKKYVQGFHNKLGEKLGFGKGALGKGAKGLAGLGGNLLRMAGPIAALGGLAKMGFDFWNSGGAARALATAKMMGGNKMLGPKGLADMKGLEDTEAFRRIDAEFLYKKPLELRQQLQQDIFNLEKQGAMEMLQYNQSLIKDQFEYEIGLMKDKMVFVQQQAMQTLDAENEKRSALQQVGLGFIKKYQTISERALKAVGSSTQEIVATMAKFQSVFGKGIPAMTKITEQAAALSKYLGGSVDDVLNMTKLFKIGVNISAEMASNLIGGLGKNSLDNGLVIGALFGQISNAAEEIAKFGDMNYNNLVREAGILTKMSVSYKEMLGATDSMVLNYKDSIKSEMSLSAMLGRNVNLSEVRARLMSNDTVGAANALKSSLGGMDINAMNAFQRQALAQATGMSTTALMALLQGSGGNMDTKLTANQEAGKQIAEQMRKTEVANAGAKLGLEQTQRLELLKFEQRQRLAMLMVEQNQRMAGIQLEAAYRVKWSLYYEKQNIKDLAKAEAAVDAATSVFAAGILKTRVEDAFGASGLKLPEGQSMEGILSKMTKLQEAGFVNDSNLKEIVMKITEGKTDLKTLLNSYGGEIYDKQVNNAKIRKDNQIGIFTKLASLSSGNYTKAKQTEFEALYAKLKTTFPELADRYQKTAHSGRMDEIKLKSFLEKIKNEVTTAVVGPIGTAKETTNLTTAVSTLNTTMNATIPASLEKTTVQVAAGTKQAKDDSFNLKNVLQQIFQAEANGYTKLLRQGEVTNELLSNVIDATLQGKNITMDGTRVTKALQKVKNNQYGLGSTVQTTTGVTGYASSIIAG
jgi:hypothetical protein